MGACTLGEMLAFPMRDGTGAICGIRFPNGLHESDRLPSAIFTPAWKAPAGQHDENVPFHRVRELVGDEMAEQVRTISLALYARGAALCERVGIILADTKFEFGLLPSGELLLIDEVMTPDSSRFWDASDYEPGRAQASYDKQFVRDHLVAIKWNQSPPAPRLPAEVITRTKEKYLAALRNLIG